jgi:hypothetical protein
MSDVERFYESARKHFPNSKPWSKLNPFEQTQLIHGINLILGIMTNE